MAQCVFCDDPTNCYLEQVPRRWGSIPDVSIARLWTATMDHRSGRDRDLHIDCLNRFTDADYQSTF